MGGEKGRRNLLQELQKPTQLPDGGRELKYRVLHIPRGNAGGEIWDGFMIGGRKTHLSRRPLRGKRREEGRRWSHSRYPFTF